MNVAILSAGRGWHTDELCAGAQRPAATRPGSCRSRPWRRASAARRASPPAETALEACDAVLRRASSRAGSLEQIIFRVDALHWLEALGVAGREPGDAPSSAPSTSSTPRRCWSEAGLQTPRTSWPSGCDAAMAAFAAMGDVIVKPLFGSNGRGMVRVSDEEIAYRVFRALELERAVYYVQQALPHPGPRRARLRRRRARGGRGLAQRAAAGEPTSPGARAPSERSCLPSGRS